MVCQISWIQIEWQKNQICFYHPWSRKLNTLCLESALQRRRKRTSSGFWLELNGGQSRPPSLFRFRARIPLQIPAFFSQHAYYLWVGGTKWNTESASLPGPHFSRCLKRTDSLDHACSALGGSVPSPVVADLT